MNWTDYLNQPITVVIILVLYFVVSYLNEKGKNLATREDVQEITRLIEAVKTENAKELEGLKAQLNARFHAQTVRFEKEFQAYKQIWKTLLRLRNATRNLRPRGDFYTTDDLTADEEKQRRFKEYRDSFKAFYPALYDNEPFIPSEIFSHIDDLLGIIVSEASEFKTCLDLEIDALDDISFWDAAEKNVKLILGKVDDIREKIRQRIESF